MKELLLKSINDEALLEQLFEHFDNDLIEAELALLSDKEKASFTNAKNKLFGEPCGDIREPFKGWLEDGDKVRSYLYPNVIGEVKFYTPEVQHFENYCVVLVRWEDGFSDAYYPHQLLKI